MSPCLPGHSPPTLGFMRCLACSRGNGALLVGVLVPAVMSKTVTPLTERVIILDGDFGDEAKAGESKADSAGPIDMDI